MTAAQADLLRRLRALAQAAGPNAAGPEARRAPAAAVPGGERPRRTLRIGVETLDRLLDLAGEIAVSRGRLRDALERGSVADAAEIHREADRLHGELQELVMKARMEPLGPVLRRFARTVRDLGAELDKRARLVVEGEEIDVDTKVVEHVRDPLTHLVRNALAHGLEPAAEREGRGKDPCGTVRLRARREPGAVVLEVEDDGRGLGREAIARRAREAGLVAPDAAPSDQEVQALIFEPGFSTAARVTEVAGRGVGLDVVRRNVEALRGSVTVESRAGEGTRFTIRLPLSLSIIPGFAVGAQGDTFILPIECVAECLELPAGALLEERRTGVVGVRGEPLPCRRLRRHFGLGPGAARREHVVVLQHAGRRLGLVVDELFGETQAVLKPLGRLFRGVAGIAGSAVLGSGRVALVIDLPGLFREAA